MGVFGFLKLRLDFIKQLHERSCAPFELIKQQIKDGVPPYREDGEPPFLAEWLEGDESLQVLGFTCKSMLSASLQLFLKAWEKELGKSALPQYKTFFKNNGWINSYLISAEPQLGKLDA